MSPQALEAEVITLRAEVKRLRAIIAAKPAPTKRTSLTRKQRELLDFIGQYQDEHRGVSPSLDEMAAGVGYASKGAVHRVLTCLEERGAIERVPNRARALRIVEEA